MSAAEETLQYGVPRVLFWDRESQLCWRFSWNKLDWVHRWHLSSLKCAMTWLDARLHAGDDYFSMLTA